MTRRAGYGKRVEQAMSDLLGVFGGRRVDLAPGPNDRLPTGVAARLALIIASSDAAVLTRGLQRGAPADQKARRAHLAACAVAQLPDLLADVELPVRCGARTHRLVLRADDTVDLTNHPGIDLATERVAAALGSPLLPCVQQCDHAFLRWPPPVADDGPRVDPIGAGELLAFVQTSRSWLRHGYPVTEAALPLEQGVAYGDVVGHLNLGLTVEQAVDWSFAPAGDAARWTAIGFRSDDARLWLSQGRMLGDAEAAVATADEGRWLARWMRIVGGALDAAALADWVRVGLPVGVWGEIASRGMLAADARQWTAAGFTSVEILRYAHLRVGIDEALRWRDCGFTGFVATGCLGVGMTLEDAFALRALPTREVQDAWRAVRSVEGVRAMVSP